MQKKISFMIDGKKFDLSIDEEFAPFLQKQMVLDLNIDGNNEVKRVLEAYIRKTYELYQKEKKIADILKSFD